jgi:V-type H+-transporting ATPase subunit E
LEQLFEDAGKDVKELASGDKYAKALEAFILEVSFDLISLHLDVPPASQAKDVFTVSKSLVLMSRSSSSSYRPP